MRRHRSADLLHRQPLRRDVEEDRGPSRAAGSTSAQHDRRDEERRDGSAAHPPEARITTPAIAVAMKREQVGEDVLEAALDVERAPVRAARAATSARKLTPMPAQRDDEDHAPLRVGARRGGRTPS
jgi:hypothetical protein